MSNEWELPVPGEDPEIYKAGIARNGDGGARLVPSDNMVEGDIEDDGRKGPGTCPFSSP